VRSMILLAAALAWAGSAEAQSLRLDGHHVTVKIEADRHGACPIYRATSKRPQLYVGLAEMSVGDQYRITVTPHERGRRYAVGLSVDGLCTLTRKQGGGRSANSWTMRHMIERGKGCTISGWREWERRPRVGDMSYTIRRFTVTSAANSLNAHIGANPWAIGVIWVTVFPEKGDRDYWDRKSRPIFGEQGTGAGERMRSPVRVREFESERYACEEFGIAYRTAEALGRMQIGKQQTTTGHWSIPSRETRDGFVGRLPRTD